MENKKSLLGVGRASYIDANGNIYTSTNLGGNSVGDSLVTPPAETTLAGSSWTSFEYKTSKSITNTLSPQQVLSCAFTATTGVNLQQVLSIACTTDAKYQTWLSETANGLPITGSTYEKVFANSVFSYTSGLTIDTVPEVTQGTTYYFNIKNLSNSLSSTVRILSRAYINGAVCTYDNSSAIWASPSSNTYTRSLTGSPLESAIKLDIFNEAGTNSYPYFTYYGYGNSCQARVDLRFPSIAPIDITRINILDPDTGSWNSSSSAVLNIYFDALVSNIYPSFDGKKIKSIYLSSNTASTLYFVNDDWLIEGNVIRIKKANAALTILKQISTSADALTSNSFTLKFNLEDI